MAHVSQYINNIIIIIKMLPHQFVMVPLWGARCKLMVRISNLRGCVHHTMQQRRGHALSKCRITTWWVPRPMAEL